MNTVIRTKNYRQGLLIYLKLLQEFHKLTLREMKLLVELIIRYNTLKTKYDELVANKLYLNRENREEIKKELGFGDQQFRNYLTALRKKGVLKDAGITSVFTSQKLNINIKIEHES